MIVKLCGVLVQGTKAHNGFFVVMHTHGVRKDADSVSTLVFEVLRWCKEPQIKQALVISDNASGEGKNETVLCVLNMTVWYDWYAEIGLRSLFPGHAHSYLDALFSHLQRAMRWTTMCSLADLARALSHALSNEPLRPILCVLERAVDWTNYLSKVMRGIHGHSGPLEFRMFRSATLPDSPARMLSRTTSELPWEGVDRSNEPIELMTALPHGLPKLKPLRMYDPEDAAAVRETIHAAENRKLPLIHGEEAEALRKIVSDGSSGVRIPSSHADGKLGVAGHVRRPGTNTDIAVRVIASPPRTLQAPSEIPISESAASATPAKAPVPLFYQPRVSVISYSATTATKLKAIAQAEADAKDAGSGSAFSPAASVSASASDSDSTSAPSHTMARSRSQLRSRSTTPMRQSPRTTQATKPKRHGYGSGMIDLDKVDDDDD